MTHRVFSRNASSSRAVQVAKLIKMVESDPAMPVSFGVNKPGMQAGEELPADVLAKAQMLWQSAVDAAVTRAKALAQLDPPPHKQVINRILEPFAHITTIVTATDFENFFWLRYAAEADPTLKALAERMFDVYTDNEPDLLAPGDYHLPFVGASDYLAAVDSTEDNAERIRFLCDISAARCARVSYFNHDGTTPDVAKDLDLARNRLRPNGKIHASPFEHQATPDQTYDFKGEFRWRYPDQHGNFTGWRQYRKTIPGETFDGYFTPPTRDGDKKDVRIRDMSVNHIDGLVNIR
jgi:hypothetical protein